MPSFAAFLLARHGDDQDNKARPLFSVTLPPIETGSELFHQVLCRLPGPSGEDGRGMLGPDLSDIAPCVQSVPVLRTSTRRYRFMQPCILILLTFSAAYAQTMVNGRPALVLETKSAKMVLELGGGSVSDFHLPDNPMNPLTWTSKGDPSVPRLMGHFLCLDRWGQPSEAEQRNGMPFHGEASRVTWRVINQPTRQGDKQVADMSASLPLAGLDVARRIRLSTDTAFFVITERVANRNKLGRIYNMVQHPSIAPPFLDEATLVDANAKTGFMQSSPLPNPEQPKVEWPNALNKGRPVDVRRLLIDDDYGWVTASSVSNGLLIGYLWKTSDYPWFNAWRNTDNGRPAARGLEFGTTGLHQPFSVLIKKGRIFDRPLYAYLDAGQTEVRSYACFLFRIPRDYKGVARITYAHGRLQLQERDGGRELTMAVGNLFAE
jgi:hypothetical protein